MGATPVDGGLPGIGCSNTIQVSYYDPALPERARFRTDQSRLASAKIALGDRYPLNEHGWLDVYTDGERVVCAPNEGVEMSESKRPKVKLIGEDGNAFAILGRCLRAARAAGWTDEQRRRFQDEAASGDYNKLLATVQEYFDVR